jgi:hypothetical protein
MKIAKTALVSTISLGIAISTAAFAANPSPFGDSNSPGNSPAQQKAMKRPQLPITGKQACANNILTLPSAVPTDAGVGITFFLGVSKPVALLFSGEIFTLSGTDFLTYSIDGGAAIPIGPTFFANEASPASRTAYGVVMPPFVTTLLSAGTHTITPILTAQSGGALSQIRNRCFSVLNTGV